MAQRLHKDDQKAVFLEASRLVEKEDSVLIYKPYMDDVVHGPKEIDDLPNAKELFMFASQTESQLKQMKKHGSKILIVDETHGTNQYKYDLVTAMVIDENRRGWPVGHLITSKSDTSTLKFFFQCLNSRVAKDEEVSCAMTDDDGKLINSMEEGFSKKLKHLLCKWHVIKNWKKNVRLKAPNDLYEPMMSELKAIMNAENETLFLKLKTGFLKKYEKNPNASEVLKYLENHYWKRAEKWASCYRNFPHGGVNTTGHIESFHSRLKMFYLKRKVNKRLDDLINLLYQLAWDDHCTRLREASIGFSVQPQEIAAGHKRGLLMEEDEDFTEQAPDKLWEIKSATGKSSVYIIERYKAACAFDGCVSKCIKRECYSLCAHIFSCSCPDAHPLCKHIHKLQSFLTRGDPFMALDNEEFYIFGNAIPEELHIVNHEEANEDETSSSHDRQWQGKVERLKNSLSLLQQFLNAAQDKKVPEHTLTRLDAVLADLVCGILPSENHDNVESLETITPAVSFTPNETLKTQMSQLAPFRRPPKRKSHDNLSVLAAKKKAAIENLLSFVPITAENVSVDVDDAGPATTYEYFTPPSSYVSNHPLETVFEMSGKQVSFLHLKSLELQLSSDEEMLYKKCDPIFTVGLVPASIIDVFFQKLSEKFHSIFVMFFGASNLQENRDLIMNKSIILMPSQLTEDQWIILVIFIKEKEIRYYDPSITPPSQKSLSFLAQVVANMKAIFPSPSQWIIKLVLSPKQDLSINSSMLICQYALKTVDPSVTSRAPYEIRKFIYSFIVGKCLKRSNYSQEQCGKCLHLFDEDESNQQWVTCCHCQQWFHESCVDLSSDVVVCQ